jgi:hypothetical protein
MDVMKAPLIFAFTLVNCVLARVAAQSTLEGRIIDPKGKPIPYAAIGIPGTPYGTLTDENGNYQLDISVYKPTDTVKIRALGFTTRSIPASKIIRHEGGTIKLLATTHQLPELVIKAGKTHTVVLGNSRYNKNVYCSFTGEGGHYKGAEAAIRANNKKKRIVRILDFNFYILNNTSRDSVPMRLNFYYPGANDLPGFNPLREPVYFKTALKYGIVHVDLKRHDIVLEGDFFISLECLSDKMGKDNLTFSGSIVGPSYIKSSAFDYWAKVGVMGLDFNVTAEYTK